MKFQKRFIDHNAKLEPIVPQIVKYNHSTIWNEQD